MYNIIIQPTRASAGKRAPSVRKKTPNFLDKTDANSLHSDFEIWFDVNTENITPDLRLVRVA